jgi:hypothetical protein
MLFVITILTLRNHLPRNQCLLLHMAVNSDIIDDPTVAKTRIINPDASLSFQPIFFVLMLSICGLDGQSGGADAGENGL